MQGQKPSTQERWSSRLGFILATIGSAIGVGNLWRFPYLVGMNGGGAFLVPYFLAIALCGLPILMLELAGGRRFRQGVVGTFRAVRPVAGLVGAFIAFSSFLLLSYYLVVVGWAWGYLVHSLGGSFPAFGAYTSGYNSVLFFLVLCGVTVGIVGLGVRRGIELASRILMPTLFLLVLGLAVFCTTLPGWREGIVFYLYPKPSALADPLVWAAAFGQVFFSVGVGMGVMITYGSYAQEKEPIASSSLWIVLADASAALLAGFVVFPIVFSYGGEPAAGPGLAFDTLPHLFRQFSGATGQVVAGLFYLLLGIAGIGPSVSLLQTALVGLEEGIGVPRRRALPLVAVALVLLGLPSALSYSGGGLRLAGAPVLDILDNLTGLVLLPLGVLATAVVLGWLAPTRLMVTDVQRGFVGWSGTWLVRFAVPLSILGVLGATVFQRLVR
ncbi:MAG: sodium-dependent transporter [Dehalococcoidia bacterium]|nr:sodium-dependent transporter [Dehalococcoidia bacterium]MDW8119975.1 sodium-dependent transporter [Chloroflexota bacterium]